MGIFDNEDNLYPEAEIEGLSNEDLAILVSRRLETMDDADIEDFLHILFENIGFGTAIDILQTLE